MLVTSHQMATTPAGMLPPPKEKPSLAARGQGGVNPGQTPQHWTPKFSSSNRLASLHNYEWHQAKTGLGHVAALVVWKLLWNASSSHHDTASSAKLFEQNYATKWRPCEASWHCHRFATMSAALFGNLRLVQYFPAVKSNSVNWISRTWPPQPLCTKECWAASTGDLKTCGVLQRLLLHGPVAFLVEQPSTSCKCS